MESTLAVNHDRIGADPELLRQWIHHRRAELVFAHWALGHDPRRFLLDPESPPAGRTRLAALASCARSLEVLVPDEGRILAGRIIAAWNCQAARGDPAYAPSPEDPESRQLKRLHLETLGDLAMLCLLWKPDGRCAGLVEEVLALLEDEAAFFDGAVFHEALQGKQDEAGYPVRLLSGFMSDAMDLDPARPHRITDDERSGIAGRLTAELLLRFAYRVYEDHRGTDLGAARALDYIERAERRAPDDVRVKLAAARFHLVAGHDDAARSVLAQLHRSARARDPEVHQEIDELRRILDERAASRGSGLHRTGGAAEPPSGPRASTAVADLEAEIDHCPDSIQVYEELARKLATDGRFDEAVDWSERAMTRCLGRDGQLRARSLNLELLGLSKLAGSDPAAARLYAAGAHGPALDALGAIPDLDPPDSSMEYLHGRCLLAIGRPDDALRHFERALEHCGRQLHRTVLRGLVMDVDQPYLFVARRAIADRLEKGELETALREAWAMMLRLRRPEAALIDLAQIHLDSAAALAGGRHETLPAPTAADLEALCGGRLAETYAASSDVERARRLAQMCLSLHPPSRRRAEQILLKADALETQAALAGVLARSGTLLRAGDFPGRWPPSTPRDRPGRASRGSCGNAPCCCSSWNASRRPIPPRTSCEDRRRRWPENSSRASPHSRFASGSPRSAGYSAAASPTRRSPSSKVPGRASPTRSSSLRIAGVLR